MYIVTKDGVYNLPTTDPSIIAGCASSMVKFYVAGDPTLNMAARFSQDNWNTAYRSVEAFLATYKDQAIFVEDIKQFNYKEHYFDCVRKSIVSSVGKHVGRGKVVFMAWSQEAEYKAFPVSKMISEMRKLSKKGYLVKAQTTKFHNSTHTERNIKTHPGNTVVMMTVTYIGKK